MFSSSKQTSITHFLILQFVYCNLAFTVSSFTTRRYSGATEDEPFLWLAVSAVWAESESSRERLRICERFVESVALFLSTLKFSSGFRPAALDDTVSDPLSAHETLLESELFSALLSRSLHLSTFASLARD